MADPTAPRSSSTAAPPAESRTLSLHDALPISGAEGAGTAAAVPTGLPGEAAGEGESGFAIDSGARIDGDRKSTRLNSSHVAISYAVFCLKKKKNARAPTPGKCSPAAAATEVLT